MSYSSIAFENDGQIARIRLRRPPLNILNLAMIAELNRALGELRGVPGLRAVVLSAEGKAFSAGVSVEEHMPATVREMVSSFHEVFRQLRALACPTLAAVQGAALGGGCELACFADWVIASEAASLGLPEVKLGVFPPIAAVHFPARIGVARTLQLVLSGDVLPAADSLRVGLVDQVVPAAELDTAIYREVVRLRERSASALRLAKRAVQLGADLEFDARLREVERLYLDELMTTKDAVEGLKAFVEKRTPRWSS